MGWNFSFWRTGDIGLFKAVSETGVAAGVRRIEAVTGDTALALFQKLDTEFSHIAFELGFNSATVEIGRSQVSKLKGRNYELEKELARLKAKLAFAQGDDLVSQAIEMKGSKVLAVALEGADINALRETMDKLRDKLKSAAVVLASTADGKVTLIAGVTPDLTARIKAGELVNMVARQVGGKGGGRPDMAQAGGSEPGKLPAALASVAAWVEQRL